MQPRGPIETDILLLGAGHAHVEVLRRFAMQPEPGVRLTLIGREPETPYTGMLPGLIRGDYTFEQAHVDLAPLAASANARLILTAASTRSLNLDNTAWPCGGRRPGSTPRGGLSPPGRRRGGAVKADRAVSGA